MDVLIKQTRVRSGLGRDSKESSNSIRERNKPPQQRESIKGDKKVQNWFRRQFSSQMSLDHDSRNGEFETAVGAAAFAIYSLEEASSQYQKKMRDGLDNPMTKLSSRKEDTTIGLQDSGRVSIRHFGNEGKDAGEAPIKSRGKDWKASESASTTSKPSHPSSVRPNNQVSGGQKQNEDSARRRLETKADTWQQAAKKKIRKRLSWSKEGKETHNITKGR